MVRARALLDGVFGFADFRPGQADIVEALLGGADVLAVMPTGSGKSLCYQLPALVRDKLTVVVSPLIALMRDQVAQLRLLGVEAGALNSSNPPEENRRVLDAVRAGRLRLLYAAPERLLRRDTIELLAGASVGLLAVDEAHCVSRWGHDFRPEYLEIGRLRAALSGVQTLALTATADAGTRSEIEAGLFDSPPRQFVHGFDRPNIRLAMGAKTRVNNQLLAFVKSHPGDSGIVYCRSRKRTESFAELFRSNGIDAVAYHAGMDKTARDENQDKFQRDDGVVVVATTTFGMGIEKPDVRFVAHADMPENMESYYQEIGRAGRDGLAADTLTLYGLDDIRLRRTQIEDGALDDEQKRVARQRLTALVALCEAPRCRRQTLLAYFGETTDPCGNCDLCEVGAAVEDGTVDARKLMSAVVRTGERFGTEHIIAILRGQLTDNVERFRHQDLPTFGVGEDRSAHQWRSIFRQLYAAGLINLDIANYGRWAMTDAGWRVLRGHEIFEMRTEALSPARGEQKSARRTSAALDLSDVDMPLLDALKAHRRVLAEERGVPAYVIFPDCTLAEIARDKPRSREALRGVHGVGEAKLDRYGETFLLVVETNLSDDPDLPAAVGA